MGQEREERSHQENHRPRHPVIGARDHGHERFNQLHHLPRRSQEDTSHQATIPRHDYQERKQSPFI